MAYDPANIAHRAELAHQLRAMLGTAGFVPCEAAASREEVYRRPHHRDPRVLVKVYTTIEGGAVRAKDADAIRVCAVYQTTDPKSGEVQYLPISKAQARVFRTGSIEDQGKRPGIVTRTLHRMREVYGAATTGDHCRHCGAPTGVSKRGKVYCLDRCWICRQ